MIKQFFDKIFKSPRIERQDKIKKISLRVALLSAQGMTDFWAFLISFCLFILINELFYNIYSVLLMTLQRWPFFLTFCSYAFPALLGYMAYCVLVKRIKFISKKYNLYSTILIVSLPLLYLHSVGLEIYITQFFSPIFFVFCSILFFVSPLMGALWIFLLCLCARGKENVSQFRVSGTRSFVCILILILINNCFGFSAWSPSHPYAPLSTLTIAKSAYPMDKMRIAYAYAQGVGVPKDDTKAIDWYEKSYNDDGAIDAAYYIGLLYDEMGSSEKAQEWYKKAANAGSDWAKYKLGLFSEVDKKKPITLSSVVAPSVDCVDRGKGIDITGCRSLAIMGNSSAQFLYAEALRKQNVEKSLEAPANIVFWYEQAAKKNHIKSQWYAARFFQDGEFYTWDIAKAVHWYSKASKNGYIWYKPRVFILSILLKKSQEG
jgi:TPR repeat protein